MKPKFLVSSKDSMFDAKLEISIKDLPPGKDVTLHSFTSVDNGNAFECVAQYISDCTGCIDLANDRSISGSFIGVEPMGLFWAMKPSCLNEVPYARLAKINVTTPLVVTIKAYDASIKSLEEIHDMRKKGNLDQLELASVKVNRWFMAQGTKRITLTLKENGIVGTLFLPLGDGPFPGVITMFGGYPGTMEFKAALLASHGFAALALAYAGLPGLPEYGVFIELKLEYFEKAVNIMLAHNSVDEKCGIGVIGLSFSSSVALAMGECLKNVKCVISICGFTYPMFGRISYKDKVYLEQPFLENPPAPPTREIEGRVLIYGRYLFPNHVNPLHSDLDKSRIKFYDRHDVAYMLIAGLGDNSVPSEYYLNQAEKLLKHSRHPNFKLLRYPGAGHLIEPCYGIHHRITEQKLYLAFADWGGEMILHCKAQEDSWQQQIEFLRSNLTPKNKLSKL